MDRLPMIPARLGADEMRPLKSATILAEAMLWGNCATAERATGRGGIV